MDRAEIRRRYDRLVFLLNERRAVDPEANEPGGLLGGSPAFMLESLSNPDWWPPIEKALQELLELSPASAEMKLMITHRMRGYAALGVFTSVLVPILSVETPDTEMALFDPEQIKEYELAWLQRILLSVTVGLIHYRPLDCDVRRHDSQGLKDVAQFFHSHYPTRKAFERADLPPSQRLNLLLQIKNLAVNRAWLRSWLVRYGPQAELESAIEVIDILVKYLPKEVRRQVDKYG